MSKVTGPDGETYSSEFEQHLGMLAKAGGEAEPFREALTHVSDTAYGCLLWFRSQGLKAEASDIMTMTKLVMEYVALPRE